MDSLLLKVPFIMHFVAVMWVVCAVVLILVILIQKGRGTGLSGAFGGGMAGGILGTKTGDFLTWVTVGLVGALLLLTVAMAKFYKPMATAAAEDTAVQTQPIQEQPVPGPQADTNLPVGGQVVPESADVTDQNSGGQGTENTGQ